MNRRFILLLLMLAPLVSACAAVTPTPQWTEPAPWNTNFNLDPGFAVTNTTEIDPGFYVTNSIIPDPGFYVDPSYTNYSMPPVDIEKHRLNKCEWCSTRDTSVLAVRHVVPAKQWKEKDGDYNGIENLVTLCDRCNFVVLHRCNYRAPAMVNFRKVLEASK